MTSTLAEKLINVRDFHTILEITAKEIGESYSAASEIVLSNPLDSNVTAICEYISNSQQYQDSLPITTFPLHLEGGGLGLVSLARTQAFSPEEKSKIRTQLAQIENTLRYAQINDMVQRDTFRRAFMSEISTLTSSPIGLGDMLFMVVSILGKALNCSRCIVISLNDTQTGWKYHEYCQVGKVKSLQNTGWPTKDSAIVFQALFSNIPVEIFEGQPNSYKTPVQEEMDFIAVKSLLGVSIRSESSLHGCIILQQCAYRHAWTRSEIDMVQDVADALADLLLKIPQEKRMQESIMHLYQHEVAGNKERTKDTARDLSNTASNVRQAVKNALGQTVIPRAKTTEKFTKTPTLEADSLQASAKIAPSKDISELVAQAEPQVPAKPVDSQTETKVLRSKKTKASSKAKIDDSEAITNKLSGGLVSNVNTADFHSKEAINKSLNQDSSSATPMSRASSTWGNLDAIPTPHTPNVHSGLSSTMLSKAKLATINPQTSGLSSSFTKEKSKLSPQPYIEGPPIELDDRTAKEKIDEALSGVQPENDYIFTISSIDASLLSRLNNWVSQVEEKDRFSKGHARAVAECAGAIARQLGLDQEEINQIKLAAMVHDIGKLGLPMQILQKPEDDLTDAELVMRMNHPVQGAKLLEEIPELAHLAPIVLSHHEEYDGNGYPSGLQGQEIPLAARILSVADAYHCLISDMVYKSGVSVDEAQKELLAQAGKSYDPNVVQALIACIKSGQYHL